MALTKEPTDHDIITMRTLEKALKALQDMLESRYPSAVGEEARRRALGALDEVEARLEHRRSRAPQWVRSVLRQSRKILDRWGQTTSSGRVRALDWIDDILKSVHHFTDGKGPY